MRTASVLAALLLLVGCGANGDAGAADKRAEQKQEAAQEAAAEKAAEDARVLAAERAAQTTRYNACATNIKLLRTSLAQIDSRLNIGLSYDDYGDRLGDVQVAYDGVVPKLSATEPKCVGVAVALENALNAYNKVLNTWGECIDDINCDFSEGETNAKAQAGWAKARKALANSDRKLVGMKPAG